jgi:prepilin signal peptidase PulO-like enzyme (type II secretory pathway)
VAGADAAAAALVAAVTLLFAVWCAVLGAAGGIVVDQWVRRAADREERAGTMPTGADVRRPGRLDRHLTGDRTRGTIVPGLSALGCALVGLRYGMAWAVLPFLFFVPVLAGLAVVDVHTRRLPNALTLPSYGVGLVLVGVVALVRDEPAVLLRAVGAAALLFALFLLLAALPSRMGLGDVKAAGVIGLFVGSLGVGAALVAAVLAGLAAFVTGVVLVAAGLLPRRTPTPFGPYLAMGSLVAVLAGPALFRLYAAVIP